MNDAGKMIRKVSCSDTKVGHCKWQDKPVGFCSEFSSCGDQVDNQTVSNDYDNSEKPTENLEPERLHPSLVCNFILFLKNNEEQQ